MGLFGCSGSKVVTIVCMICASSSSSMAFQQQAIRRSSWLLLRHNDVVISSTGRRTFITTARCRQRPDDDRRSPLRVYKSSSSSSSITLRNWSFLSATQQEVDPGIVEGTNLRIVKYPHSSLRATNALVTDEEIENGSIAKIAREMLLVMYAAEGVGLAAPQVGINKRLMVYNESGDKTKWLDEVILVNPTITEYSDTTDIETEGCLSFPDMNGQVERSKWIKVEAYSLKGKKIKKKFKGWEARIFQHEYDHLDGKVYIDRLIDEESKVSVQDRLETLIQEHDATAHGPPAL